MRKIVSRLLCFILGHSYKTVKYWNDGKYDMTSNYLMECRYCGKRIKRTKPKWH